MFRTILLLLIASIPFMSSAQLDTFRQNEGNGRVYIKILSNDAIVEEGYLQDGKLDGAWTTYHSNGEPNTIIVYNKGYKNGMVMKMTDEGRPEYIKHYRQDKLDGEQRIFNANNGKLLEVANYANGFKQGSYRKFFQSGALQERVHYNKGVRTGKLEHFSEGGKLAYEIDYNNNDAENGTAVYYFPDGEVKEQGTLKDGKRSGFWKEYMHGGAREIEGNYIDGEKDGEWKEFFNGTLEKSVTYSKGKIINKK
jgi:antitoxin component YwqK of YwqJK toxin-antitoxin module